MALQSVATLLTPVGAKVPEHGLAAGHYTLSSSEGKGSQSTVLRTIATLLAPVGAKGLKARSYGRSLHS